VPYEVGKAHYREIARGQILGQAVLTFGGAIEYFVNTVFNYPTLAECYKTAAFDGINRLGVAPHQGLALDAQPGIGVGAGA